MEREEGDIDKCDDGVMRRLLEKAKADLDEEGVGKNVKNDPITVKHSDLQRYNDESPYKSKCPSCERGVLLVYRAQKSPYQLLPDDRCIFCGQHIIYSDIDEMRDKLG